MNFDELIKEAWQGETGGTPAPDLIRRVHRQRWRRRLLRGVEVALTVAALLVFGQGLLGVDIRPAAWLLMPFYVVFLPVVWFILLRAPRQRSEALTERVSTYAQRRLVQLRAGLRDLWLARMAAGALLGYAVLANLAVWRLAADAHWRDAALLLLAMAAAWLAATLWLNAKVRHRWLREYRAVRRLTHGVSVAE